MNPNNFCIIMAGGSGSRFWPMCNNVNPLMFVDIFGTGKTMIQGTFERFEQLCPRENIIIVTSHHYEQKVKELIPGLKGYQVLSEPHRRNTAPCVAYAAAVIHELNPHANIIVSPFDHAIFNQKNFIDDMSRAIAISDQRDWIVTLGAKPVDPNTKYGYIQMDENPSLPNEANLHKVVTFTEKPPREIALQFIMTGEFLWNTGIFIWRLPVLMDAYRQHLPAVAEVFFQLGLNNDQEQVEQAYAQIEPISIDYGIIEKADNVHVMEASFGWNDVETWDSLFDTCNKDSHDNAVASGRVMSYESHDCVVHIPQGETLVMQGLENYIITHNGKTIMICRRDQSELIAKFASDYELLSRQ